MELLAVAERTYPHPRERVFDVLCDNATYVRAFGDRGIVKGVAGAEMLDGRPLEAGARRKISMRDGAIIVEDILALDRPERHRYRWTDGPRPPFSWMVRSGTADWLFSETEDGTRVVWSYRFELRSPLWYPAARVAAAAFAAWMRAALEASAELM